MAQRLLRIIVSADHRERLREIVEEEEAVGGVPGALASPGAGLAPSLP